MSLPFSKSEVGENKFKDQLRLETNIGLSSLEVPPIKVICRSESRDNTSFEILDSKGSSMGIQTFSCNSGPIFNSFLNRLLSELNTLIETEELEIEVNPDDISEIANLAIGKCESRYENGNDLEDGDCLIILS